MPSDHNKRKSAKRKNKASVSQPHQGRLRSHVQILKAPSFGNAKNGKENHNISEKEAVGNGDKEQGEENMFFEFKGGEAANASEMDASENEGSLVSAIATEGISSGAENSKQVDLLKMSALDKSAEELQETNKKSELSSSHELREEYVTSVTKVDWSGGVEEKNGEMGTKEIEADNSLEDITSLVKKHVIVTEEGEAGQAAAKKEEVILAHAVVIPVTKVGWNGGLEEKSGEKDTKCIEADNSLEDITSQVKKYVLVTEEGEAGQAAAKKEDVILANAVDISAHEKEDKVMIDEHGSIKAAQDDVRDAITPKIEISHPPMVVRRASVWNCCGLLEIFLTSQH